MSTFQEINTLRKNGELEKASKVASIALQVTPDDIWIKRAMCWVLYDKCKAEADITHIITQVAALKMNYKEEGMFFDKMAWVIAKNISAQKTYTAYIDNVFEALKPLTFDASSGYSYLFKAFHKHRGEWSRYIEFCDWWNFDYFLPEDYEKYKLPNGQEVMSLVEQAYIGYAKSLLAGNDNSRIEAFIPELQRVYQTHPKYEYPPYFIAKLFQKIGDNPSAFNSLLPFVRKRSTDYWVWQILGDVSGNEEVRFSFYSKALTCRAKREMLIVLKENYAQMLCNKQLYDEAKTEIDQVLQIRREQDWSISDKLQGFIQQEWYKQARSLGNNQEFYYQNLELAEKTIYSDLQELSILVTQINKNIINFISSERESGAFSLPRSMKQPLKVGQTYDIKVLEMDAKHFCKIAFIHPCKNKQTWIGKIIDFEGRVNIAGGDRKFGIVNDDKRAIFLNHHLVSKLTANDKVKGKAVAAIDKKQKRDGWQAFEVQKL